ncbi:hypothetical protein ACQPZG_20095 [Streptomyces sp. CA-294286]|uniref:hypothetical protein n=1 Tax=Streptomyces sp. CA-294286 TaxID=3240070 RepID=UPI003D8C3383
MGATDFTAFAAGTDMNEAFRAAREEAAHEHGRSGYSGSVYEKDRAVLIDSTVGTEMDASTLARDLIRADDPRIRDKWGPAGALPFVTAEGEHHWLFFGYASC